VTTEPLLNPSVYDLRRSAIRNLTHAGVPEKSAMEISGHKTRDTFRRYLIEDLTDSASAIESVRRYLETKSKRTQPKSTTNDPGQNPGQSDGKSRKH
jgi:hypothetical protein